MGDQIGGKPIYWNIRGAGLVPRTQVLCFNSMENYWVLLEVDAQSSFDCQVVTDRFSAKGPVGKDILDWIDPCQGWKMVGPLPLPPPPSNQAGVLSLSAEYYDSENILMPSVGTCL